MTKSRPEAFRTFFIALHFRGDITESKKITLESIAKTILYHRNLNFVYVVFAQVNIFTFVASACWQNNKDFILKLYVDFPSRVI